MDNKLEKLKIDYENTKIPKELDFMVRKTIRDTKNKHRFGSAKCAGTVASVIAIAFTVAVNVSPAIAAGFADVPVLGGIVRVINVRAYNVNENGAEVQINTPQISGLGDKKLEDNLNREFISDGQKQYVAFEKELQAIIAGGGEGHIGIYTGYEVKADNESVFSIVYTTEEVAASGAVKHKAYTIDKKNKAVVSLESLFKDDSYITLISENIKEQMHSKMQADENVIYFVDSADMPEEDFKTITNDQTFYINADGRLVILFDEYTVAPGYMGSPEFVIPKDVIENVLLDRGLIK